MYTVLIFNLLYLLTPNPILIVQLGFFVTILNGSPFILVNDIDLNFY